MDSGAIKWDVFEWMLMLEMVETEKKDAFLVRFAILPRHGLANSWHFLVFVLRAHGGEVREVSAPCGPWFHVGAKDTMKREKG